MELRKKNKRYKNSNYLYVFIHNPKCGGTTIRHHIKNNLDKSEYLETDDEAYINYKQGEGLAMMRKSTELRIKSLSKSKRDRIKVVFGHFVYYGIHKLFNREGRYITFFRNPIEQRISQYNFEKILFKKKVDFPNSLFWKTYGENTGFTDWLELSQARRLVTGLLQSNLLGKSYYGDRKIFDKTREILDNFYFVGITENYDDYLLFYYILGINKFFPRQNVSKENFVEKNYKTRNLILSKSGYDQKLYKYALQLNKKFKRENNNSYSIIKVMKRLKLQKRKEKHNKSIIEYVYNFSAGLKKRSKICTRFVDFSKRS